MPRPILKRKKVICKGWMRLPEKQRILIKLAKGEKPHHIAKEFGRGYATIYVLRKKYFVLETTLKFREKYKHMENLLNTPETSP